MLLTYLDYNTDVVGKINYNTGILDPVTLVFRLLYVDRVNKESQVTLTYKIYFQMFYRWGLVKKANSQENPLSLLPSFTKYTKNRLNLTLETIR